MMGLPGAGAAPAAAAEEPKQEEKTEFDVKLAGFEAAAKIKVIKEVRAVTALGLKEAKELVRALSGFRRRCPAASAHVASLQRGICPPAGIAVPWLAPACT